MFPEGSSSRHCFNTGAQLWYLMHSCKKQFLSSSSMEQFRTTKPLKAATLSIWQLLTSAQPHTEPSQSGVLSAQAQPGEPRPGSRVIGFATLSIPPSGRGFPASLLSAKTVPIFQTVSLKPYQISGCRRQIIWAASWQMHCWRSTYSERKGTISPRAPFLSMPDPSAIHCWVHLCHTWEQLHRRVCTYIN